MRRGVYRDRLAEALEAAYGTDPALAAAYVISHIRHDVAARPELQKILKG
jgi:hypothetical protein